MRRFRKISLFYSAFFVLYIGMGLYHQFLNNDDFYPFSDWYLYSHVDQHGEIYDLKIQNGDGSTSLLSTDLKYNQKRTLAEDLGRAVKFFRRGQEKEANELVSKVANQYQLKGRVSLYIRDIERIEFYRENKWRHEYDLATFEF